MVRLVGEEGGPQVIPLNEALQKAMEMGLDLVEISPNQEPPVVKIVDYSKFKFEQIKKAKEAKKKQKVIQVKEIKLRPSIDLHDFQHKVRHAREFIEEGNKVKFTVMFRGREMVHSDLGFKVLEEVKQALEDVAAVETNPSKEGRNITMIMAPMTAVQKKRVQEQNNQ